MNDKNKTPLINKLLNGTQISDLIADISKIANQLEMGFAKFPPLIKKY